MKVTFAVTVVVAVAVAVVIAAVIAVAKLGIRRSSKRDHRIPAFLLMKSIMPWASPKSPVYLAHSPSAG